MNYTCLYSYIIQLCDKFVNKKLINYLNSINCQDKFSFIIKDLKLIIPKCPNCKLCKLKTNCKYKNWKKLNNTLKEKEKLFLNK